MARSSLCFSGRSAAFNRDARGSSCPSPHHRPGSTRASAATRETRDPPPTRPWPIVLRSRHRSRSQPAWNNRRPATSFEPGVLQVKNSTTAAPRVISSFLFLTATLAFASRASAQCANVWLPGDGVPGTNARVHGATTWDRDGPGPARPVLVVAGEFTLVGNTPANKIAVWDQTSGVFSALGSGMNGL